MEQLVEKDLFQEIFDMDIRPYFEVKEFKSDEFIMLEGERSEYLYYLTEGRAKLFLSQENGRISLINFIEAPCFIGEMELLDEQRLPQGVRAISRCRCYRIRMSECREELLQDTRFLQYLCRFLIEKATNNTNNYMRNQAYPLKVRFAEFIMKMSVNGYYREPHTEVAEFLGVTYRHLLYVLAQLVEDGLLEKTKRGYRIVDESGLEGIAESIND